MISKTLVACLSLPLLLAPCKSSVDDPQIDGQYSHYSGANLVNADVVSIYIPDTPGVAISADVLGTDGSQTTWRISPGQPSGTLSGLPFPVATLVEGPDSVHAIEDEDGVHGQVDCGIKDGVADCTAVISASGTATTFALSTETVSDKAFEAQVTGIPKNGASGMVGSTLGVVGVAMGVVYGLAF